MVNAEGLHTHIYMGRVNLGLLENLHLATDAPSTNLHAETEDLVNTGLINLPKRLGRIEWDDACGTLNTESSIQYGEGDGTHSSTLAWKTSRTEESGGLQSMGSLRVGHDWATSLSLFTFMHWRRKWQPTPVFLLENPRDGGAWWAAVYGVTQSLTRLKRLSSSSSIQ